MKKVLCIILGVAILLGGSGVYAVSSREEFVRTELPGKYSEYAVKNWMDQDLISNGIVLSLEQARIDGEDPVVESGAVLFPKKTELSLSFTLESADDYWLIAEYCAVEPKMVDNELEILVDGIMYCGKLPLLWADRSEAYPRDRYGNEVSAEQECVEDFVYNPVVDEYAIDKSMLSLELQAGEHTLVISNKEQDLYVRNICLVKKPVAKTYEEYRKEHPADEAIENITVQGELYALKSDSFIHAGSVSNLSMTPYDSFVSVMNILDGSSWNEPGQKVSWEFQVEESGWYGLSFRYAQAEDTNKPAYRRIEIDGTLPYEELSAVQFPQTRIGTYENLTVTAGEEPAFVYLTEGTHTLSMTVTMGETDEVYGRILSIMEELGNLGMQLKKLTAGSSDKNKTWDMSVYLPDTIPTLERIANEIDEVYKKLEEIGGCEPVYAQNLIYAAESLRKLLDKPRTIPNNIELISTGDNSASKYLGEVLNMLLSSPLSLDSFTLYAGEAPDGARPSVFSSIWEGYKSFAYTFTEEAAQAGYAAGNAREDVLQVWINRPVQYVNLLQQLIDSDYSVKTGQKVQLSIMPSESKLILASATGSNPDVVLGANYYTPFEFAIRGAARNLLEYEDFLSFYNDEYNLEALVPLSFENGVYGAVETQDFQVLYYRKDILESLGLTVPQTWDELREMMPALLRYSMNCYLPLSSSSAFKSLHTTTPLIYQNGGALYTDDGLKVAYDMDATTRGIQEMINLYRIYGLRQTVADFYNSFRYGDVPIGLSGFSTYLQLEVAAPELKGSWDIALAPGIEQEDGTILRYQMADSTACMIFDNTKFDKEAWEFLKWWLSSETQTKYAFMLESTYGVSYRWNTANRKSFEQLPYSEEHRDLILEQWEAQKENLRHPANYMVERELSNIWTNVVVNGDTLVTEIDRATIEANREIIRKLQEFGYYDNDKNVVREYPLMTYDQLVDLLKNRQGGTSGDEEKKQ